MDGCRMCVDSGRVGNDISTFIFESLCMLVSECRASDVCPSVLILKTACTF